MKKRWLCMLCMLFCFIAGMAVPSSAMPTIERIQAFINHRITFTFDGVETPLPEGYSVIVYNNRSYVPARFVCEKLGATVNWDPDTEVISITPKKLTSPVTGEELVIDQNVLDYTYKKLPIYYEDAKYKINAFMLSKDSYGYKLYLNLENKTENPIQLAQMQTRVYADGVEYFMRNSTITMLDTRWYQDMPKEGKTEGYIRLPNDIDFDTITRLHLDIPIITNGNQQQAADVIGFSIAI